MTTPRERPRDDFDGIDINGPWGGIRIGSGGIRMGAWGDDDWGDDDSEIRRIRRRVRQKLDLYKNLAFYVAIVGICMFLDGATGEGLGWSLWVAAIWGAFIVMQFIGTFVAPNIWGRDAEERMVRREVERQRGRVHVADPPDRGSE
jgi:hypothetical protein